jgi:hypothetical protein
MYNGLVHAHSGFRWIIIILLITSLITAFIGKNKGELTKGNKNIYLFTMISMHIQLLLGLSIYFMNLASDSHNYVSFEDGYSDNVIQFFYTIKHPVLMLLAITVFTIGRKKALANPVPKITHSKMIWLILLVILTIAYAIAWPGNIDNIPAKWA